MEPASPQPAAKLPVYPPTAPTAASDDDAGHDDDDEAPDDPESDEEDPTLGLGATLEIHLPTAGELRDARSAAERLALAGPHRITPNDPAGPGSLAEALGQLEAEGRVHGEVVDDPELGFSILYQPASRPVD